MTTKFNGMPINNSYIPIMEIVSKRKHFSSEYWANSNSAYVPLKVVANSPEEPYAKENRYKKIM